MHNVMYSVRIILIMINMGSTIDDIDSRYHNNASAIEIHRSTITIAR
jgi:hypothetical protein